MSETKIPTLKRMKEIEEQSRICGEFFEFLLGKYDVFDRSIPREQPYYISAGDYISTEHLLAEW